MNMQWSMMPPTLYASWVPIWVEILIALLIVAGGAVTLLGSLGLLRMNDFFQRMHGPAMGNTLGVMCTLLGSMLFFSFSRGQLVVHEVLIMLFVLMTAPVVGMLLARAALYRKHSAAFTAQVKARGRGTATGPASSPSAAATRPDAHASSPTTGLPGAVRPGEHPGVKSSSDESLAPDQRLIDKTRRRPQ